MENNNQKIKTIILCGGMGTRLKEETEFKPGQKILIEGSATKENEKSVEFVA